MASITLVRHGQASIHADNYDQLSPLGQQQSHALGEYLGAQQRRWDHVAVGPLVRHRQTLDQFVTGYQSVGHELPLAQTVDGMREHEAIRVVDHVVATEAEGGGRTLEMDTPATPEQKLAFFRRFDRIMRDWVNRRLDLPQNWETWQQARHRAESALAELAKHDGNIIAFTSGGFVSMAVGAALGLSDEKVYELSLEVTNSGWTELRITRAGFSLKHFNLHPHLTDPDWVTLV